MKRTLWILVSSICMACLGTGQSFRMTFTGPQAFGRVVIGAPYSGQEVSETTQTLSDGTHIARKMPPKLVFRDSQGRTRLERSVMVGPNADPSVKIIDIADPVAGYQYSINTENKVTHRVKLNAAGRNVAPAKAVSRPTPATDEPRPEFNNESLGSQMMEGLLAEGHKTTTTFPVGMQGNDRPLVSTSEFWMSQDLKVMLLSKHSDPRMGETITRLINIERSEPDPALFQIPSDYKIVDEEGRYNIVIERP